MDENTSRSEDDTGEEPEDSASSAASTAVANLSSSSRQMRNQAEKLRRDKLNQFINELAALVPMVSSSAKRLDKTSILRLSAAFLRIHQIIVNGRDIGKSMPVVPGNMNWCQCVLEGMDGILLIVTAPGKIVFVSHNIESLLGHQQIELLGQSLFNITSLEDHDELKKNLKPDSDEEECDAEDSSCVGEGPSERRRPQRRSFYLRLRHRSVSRSEQPQYEMFHIVGRLRVPPPPSPRKHKTDAQLSNDIVLVALLKPVREKFISEYSLLEATKEEWTTRHLLDSRIIFTDHRISFNSGYLSEEVTGTLALQYMHRDDVRWVMIALRRMFYSDESFGSSCYRLRGKNGEFIYVRTQGYLELSSDPTDVQSFICINTLVTKDEGERLISEMKKNYASLMNHKVEPAIMAIADKYIRTFEKEASSTDDVEDPNKLTEAIQHLIDALPETATDTTKETKDGLKEKFAKVKAAYKNMPPIPSIGVDFPVPALRRNSAGQFDRPSVLRVTQSNSNTVSVVVPAPQAQPQPQQPQPQDKQKRTTTEEAEAVLKRPRPDSVIVTERERDWPSVIRQRQDYAPQLPQDEATNPTTSVLHSPIHSDILDPRGDDYFSQCLTLPNLDDIDHDEISHLYVQDKDIWETEKGKLEQELVRGQMELKGNIQYQERQISAIKNDLTLVPINAAGGHKYRNTFTHLKAEHRKQQQMLRTLQQDHQNMQNCKDHLTMRGAHQDIGV